MPYGKIICDLAPSEDNKRNSEGDFIRLPSGRIAFVYTRYRGGFEDGNTADIAVIYSDDEGEHFTEPKIILTPEECLADNVMSVSLLQLAGGEIAMFYCKKLPNFICQVCMRKTKDFGSFSDEIRCAPDKKYDTAYMGMNNDRARRLSDGRIILPLYSPEIITNENSISNDYRTVVFKPSVALFSVSCDDGNSWEIISTAEMPYEIFTEGLTEPGVEELPGGELYAVYRNNSGRQFESISADGGKSFSVPLPSRFTSPPSPMNMKRLADGSFLFAYNPVPHYYGRGDMHSGIWTGGRNPFLLERMSGDLKESYGVYEIENDESRGFCYCAIFELPFAILLGYCAGGVEDNMTLCRLRIRKINKTELGLK